MLDLYTAINFHPWQGELRRVHFWAFFRSIQHSQVTELGHSTRWTIAQVWWGALALFLSQMNTVLKLLREWIDGALLQPFPQGQSWV